MAARGPVLGLDYGGRRIGMAVSDAQRGFAFPLGCLERGARREPDLAALREICRERAVTRVVVGLPLHLDGRAGPEAEAARAFAGRLAAATGLPVDLLDERWTTREAERALRDAPRKRRGRGGEVDAVAATLILRSYLARQGAAAGEGSADETP